MPLPLILGLGAAAAGAVGVGTGIHGAAKMKDANDTMKLCQKLHDENIESLEKQNKITTGDMDALGKKELEILNDLKKFTEIFEKIHNKPEFKEYHKNGVTIPVYNPVDIKKVSIGAGVLLGGIGGAAAGTAGGFAAAGATTAAVTALGTASTGTAIASLSGVAATNATLAALGGGALAAGGGGMALGTTVLSAATLGVGIMVGGIIFNFAGMKLSNESDEAFDQVCKERKEVNEICEYLLELSETSHKYMESISAVYDVYEKQLNILDYIVNTLNKDNWNDFLQEEKTVTENTALLGSLLYDMGKVELVLKSMDESKLNKVNKAGVQSSMDNAKMILAEGGFTELEGTDLDWDQVKESIHSNMTEAEFYRWIDFLKVRTDKRSIKIIAPYKEAAMFVKNNYRERIERAIFKYLKRKIIVSYGYMDTQSGDIRTGK